MPREKAPVTQTVTARITMQAKGLLEHDYKSLTHGVQESCRGWPLTRRAAIKEMKRTMKTTIKERKALHALKLPSDCDQKDLIEILKEQGMSCHGRVKTLTVIQATVLIDLIRNKDLELLGMQRNSDGELS
jgi:hypothetical protein